MKKYVAFLVMLLTAMMTLTGCYDSVELNDRHVVLELAIDKAKPVPDQLGEQPYYEITYTIPDAQKLSGGESLSENVKTTMVTVSPTLLKSIDEMEAKMQNSLTFSHVKAVLLGEELLKDPDMFQGIMNSLGRNLEFSRGINLLAVKGPASELTKADNYQNPMLGLYIMRYFNNTAKGLGNAKQQCIGSTLKEIQNTGVTTLPVIAPLTNEDQSSNSVNIGGAAVIKDYKLVDWLTVNETKGMNLLNGEIETMPIVASYKNQYITYVIKDKDVDLKFVDENGGPKAKVKLLVQGEISEGLSALNNQIFNKTEVEALTDILVQKIKEQVSYAIDKEQALGVDFLQFEKKLYQRNPKLWEKYQPKGPFPIDLTVEVIINNTGVIE